MQFIANGPDIPNDLLYAQEEGRLVFFCGAGISRPAGLPGFEGLVEQIYKEIVTEFQEGEVPAFDREQFDVTLELLEQRLPGGGAAVRRALAKVLAPNLSRPGATATHAALLQLARSREGALRLVTTNFDRVFHEAASGQPLMEYAAPMLPVPKSSRWNGLVYLHGLLPEKMDEAALDELVVTSGDFGRAYLTERWAARFVGELFRNYVVCFVGYSLNDPIMRYMMDALAADWRRGDTPSSAWALDGCEPGQENSKLNEWRAKGVEPILYPVPTENDHSALHKTLHEWAGIYRDGIQGKEQIVTRDVSALPLKSTRQDDFVGRVLWALSDKSGGLAKRFADHNPVPPLEWLLDAFSEARFRHGDLIRFGVPPHDKGNAKLLFSLIQRPAPYDRAPRMGLVSNGVQGGQWEWDGVMYHLARWLLRHLDDPRLVIWIAQQGGQLHGEWSRMIEDELNRLAALEREGKTAELDKIRSHAPRAIPGPLMRRLWGVLLSGRVISPGYNLDFYLHNLYRWRKRLEQEGLTTTLRIQLRDLLAPRVILKEPSPWNVETGNRDEPTRLEQLVGSELMLAADSVDLRDLKDTPYWALTLPQLLEDFQQLLRDGLDLLRVLGKADDRRDGSYLHLPSISHHEQNLGHHNWVVLIELLRDVWLAVRSSDSVRATRIAQDWFALPYPTFKRLALFAASRDECIAPEQWVDWLLADDAWWLWSTGTQREVCRLLVLQGKRLNGVAQGRLETTLLGGPPRTMYRDDLEPDRWQSLVAHSVWLRLAKLNSSGVALGADAAARFEELSSAHPEWQLEDNESDGLSIWMGGSAVWGSDIEVTDKAPRKRRDLVQWLKKTPPQSGGFYKDDWPDVCRTRFFHSLYALGDLARDGVWPPDRWCSALQVWRENDLVQRSWRYAVPLVNTMPDDVIQKIDLVHSVTRWIETATKSSNRHEDILLVLCKRILALPLEADTGIMRNGEPINDPVNDAINHPVGHVTWALLDLWFRQKPNDGDQLPAEIEPFFTELCDVKVERFRHGRVLLGMHLITFFRVDRTWTEKHLLPLFDWKCAEAQAVWEGFLWSPRLYSPLLIVLKPNLLEGAHHYNDLGEHRQKFAALLTYAALYRVEGYTEEEFRGAFTALPQEGLEHSAQVLSQALDEAAEQRKEYWDNRFQPFWHNVWPKFKDRITPQIASSLAQLAIAAGDEFPAVVGAVGDWLRPIENPLYVLHLLRESGLCTQFPKEALRLLAAVIDDPPSWAKQELGQCLDQIQQAEPLLAQDNHYRRLREYLST